MPSDAAKASQILRGHEKRISQLEEADNPDRPAHLIRVKEDEAQSSDSVTTKTSSTSTTRWDSAKWAETSDSTPNMNWS